jgi:hypothetical protein
MKKISLNFLIFFCLLSCKSEEDKDLRLVSVVGKTRKLKFKYDQAGRLIKSDRWRKVNNTAYHNLDEFFFDKEGKLNSIKFWSTVNDTLEEKGGEKYTWVKGNISRADYDFEILIGEGKGRKKGYNLFKYDNKNQLIENHSVTNGKFEGLITFGYDSSGLMILMKVLNEKKEEIYLGKTFLKGKIVKNPMALWKNAGVPLDFGFGALPLPDFISSRYLVEEHEIDQKQNRIPAFSFAFNVIEFTAAGYPSRAIVNKDTVEYSYMKY